ncbi:pyrroloquinoline quinone-dependent dehydrogenase [Flavihumibacter fluvii]|uniref:pyrroloquinoline quinone-dependent dehydrogenase n=1 Tax=Flavihumibacter fluvii TaxID=2838157 RepID=UPI001BDF4838|nr:pyrroloquinoline quinone-dependent dehydrogenase [Flavihumibacter fluvii]ULQ51520.1 pyrroloquinoline quinone-dependent dehydrogenase [Flavihumibacter fluvii]
MKMNSIVAVMPLVILLLLNSCSEQPPKTDYSGWTAYAGSKDGSRYSSNTGINIENVAQLKVAWEYSSNDKDTGNRTQNQCNPIVVDGILYGTSPKMKLFALDAVTGKEKWVFDPATEDTASKNDPFAFFKVSRGVMYWQDSSGKDKRILYSVGAKTWSIHAANGQPVRSFGKQGFIDLTENLDRDPETFNPYVAGTTPGIVFNNLLIIGTRVAESADAAPGHIRAFDIVTGQRKWIFHTIPQPGEFGYETWPDREAWKKLGGANNWAGMSLDEKRGIVYVPTGSVAGDFYGGIRKGTNLFGNSLVALDAASGKYLWHYQTIHHDLWDRDLPANPNLVTIKHDGKNIDAVAQITKHGYIFLFDRVNGKPVFPIEEIKVPASDLPGEEAWPTQPIPTLPEPFARQNFGPDELNTLFPETYEELKASYDKIKHRQLFSPPAKEGSWVFPGFDGGGEWGGAAVDPESGILYVNSTELPWALTMIDVPAQHSDASLKRIGKEVYGKYCLSCHRADLKGNGPSYPSLLNLDKKYTEEEAGKIITNGKNMMPAFKQIGAGEKKALLAFLLDLPDKEPGAVSTEKGKKSILDEVPYTMTGYNRFYDKNGYPGIKPPWGTLNAVDLNTGKLLWKVPLGEFKELTGKGIPPTGTEGYGGPLVTKGGLVFIAASKDAKIRAFDKKTGKVLWEADLPVPGYATPATYAIDGRQFVVIACGGGKIGSKSGDKFIAFALPETK